MHLRLKEFESFDVNQGFWELDCWKEEFINTPLTTSAEILEVHVRGRTIEELQVVLKELASEMRTSVDEKSVTLTGGATENELNSRFEDEEDENAMSEYSERDSDDSQGGEVMRRIRKIRRSCSLLFLMNHRTSLSRIQRRRKHPRHPETPKTPKTPKTPSSRLKLSRSDSTGGGDNDSEEVNQVKVEFLKT